MRIEALLAENGGVSNAEEYGKLLKEYASYTPTVNAYREYLSICKELEETRALRADTSADAELREMAADEVVALEEKEVAAKEQLEILLLPKDEN
ncbi:MAG: PCRF domain-containing protein, partial [Clostridia bacterium]|nr:PCRF domain-containing protein [Clostridia bacterium]